MELLSPELRRRLPPLGSGPATTLPEAVIHARFYDPDSNWKWYVLAFDGENTCFGLIVNRHAVVGQFTLAELTAIRPSGKDPGPGGILCDPAFASCSVAKLATKEPAVRALLKELTPDNDLVRLE